jgi:hypothetical protein
MDRRVENVARGMMVTTEFMHATALCTICMQCKNEGLKIDHSLSLY